MKDKKNPQRFSIQFDPSIPEHRKVIEILLTKDRYASRYIAEAVLFYENSKSDSLENTVTQVVSKMLGLNAVQSTKENPQPHDSENGITINFQDIAADLEGFKK